MRAESVSSRIILGSRLRLSSCAPSSFRSISGSRFTRPISTLGERFDRKTQLLGAFLFLVQRGIAAGITIYAPAIILSAALGWRLDLTIWFAGGLVIIYTVAGGTKIVSITQRYQMIVILVGMAIAFAVAVYRLSPDLSFQNTLSVAGKMGKLEAVDFSVDPHKRYTFWSGLIGGFFLALSYFGADQSQVQRYLAGGSLKESRLGLLFNAAVKVPMQFFILLLGAIVFMFYQFEKPPLYFNQAAYQRAVGNGYAPQLAALQTQFDDVFMQKRALIRDGFQCIRRSFRQMSAMWRRPGCANLTLRGANCAIEQRQFSSRLASIQKTRIPITFSLLLFFNKCRMDLSDY